MSSTPITSAPIVIANLGFLVSDLTQKTGNYKQFDIFVSMIESALTKTSDSVTLDLLTYADLQLLRNQVVARSGAVCRLPVSYVGLIAGSVELLILEAIFGMQSSVDPGLASVVVNCIFRNFSSL